MIQHFSLYYHLLYLSIYLYMNKIRSSIKKIKTPMIHRLDPEEWAKEVKRRQKRIEERKEHDLCVSLEKMTRMISNRPVKNGKRVIYRKKTLSPGGGKLWIVYNCKIVCKINLIVKIPIIGSKWYKSEWTRNKHICSKIYTFTIDLI